MSVPKSIRLYGLVTDSVVDGLGYRTAIFTQGCPHACPACHNMDSHDPNSGTVWEIDKVIEKFSNNPLLAGITLSGGEPFMQPEECAYLAKVAHEKALDVWTFTGFTLEQLWEKAKENKAIGDLLAETDVLVDGPFIVGLKSIELNFCGSSNQRLIDMKKTTPQNIVLYTLPTW